MTLLLAVDPGVTTGWAVLTPEKVLWTHTTVKLLELADAFDFALRRFHPVILVFERYRIFKPQLHMNSEVYPIQVIGALRLLAYQNRLEPLPLDPSVKGSVPKKVFADLRPPGTLSEHEKDAIKLGIYWFLRNGA